MSGSALNPTTATPSEASYLSTNGTDQHGPGQEVHIHISPANGLPHATKPVVVHLHTEEPAQQGNSGAGHDSPANGLPHTEKTVVVHLHTDEKGQQANRGEGHDLPTPATDIAQEPPPAVVQHHHHHHWDTGNACDFPMPGESAAPGSAAGQQQQSGPQGISGQEKEASGTKGIPAAIALPAKAKTGEDVVGVVDGSITPPVPGEAILFVHPVNGYSSMG